MICYIEWILYELGCHILNIFLFKKNVGDFKIKISFTYIFFHQFMFWKYWFNVKISTLEWKLNTYNQVYLKWSLYNTGGI